MPDHKPMDSATKLRAADGVLRRSAGGEIVLLDLESEEFFGLDGVGARVFELLEEPRTLDEVVDVLHAEYEVDRPILEQDVSALLADLTEHKLVSEA